MKESALRPPSPTTSASGLLGLPLEIRIEIWKLTIPEPRVRRIAFEMIPGGVQRAYDMSPIVVPTILHICRDSRDAARRLLRLGFGASTHPRDKNWWNPQTDTLYLPGWNPPPHWDLSVTREFLAEDTPTFRDLHWDGWVHTKVWHDNRQKALCGVRHLALPWQESFLVEFGVFGGEDWGLDAAGPPWLKGFPNLQSVSFLVDHYPTWYRTGDILLYEPLDGSVLECFDNESPAEFEWRIEGALDDFRLKVDPGWTPPSVEILILGHRKTRKRSGFCLPPPAIFRDSV